MTKLDACMTWIDAMMDALHQDYALAHRDLEVMRMASTSFRGDHAKSTVDKTTAFSLPDIEMSSPSNAGMGVYIPSASSERGPDRGPVFKTAHAARTRHTIFGTFHQGFSS